MAYTIYETGDTILEMLNSIGDVSQLDTKAKSTLVAAINELFTSVSDGKATIAAAITDMGVSTAANASFSTMANNIRELGGPAALVKSLTFTGTYATSTYFTEATSAVFGCPDGRLALIMENGTSTSYENLYFTMATGSKGTLVGQSTYRYSSAKVGTYYVAILSGITSAVDITVDMSTRNSSYDYVECEIMVSAA